LRRRRDKTDKKNREDETMMKPFQQQAPLGGGHLPHPEPKPQHGQKPDAECLKVPEKRSFEPRPAH
jgi:hypothetical protein